jgi:hypothetical protein
MFVLQLLQWKTIIVTFVECVCVALAIQHGMCMRHIVCRLPAVQYPPQLSHKSGTILEKRLQNNKYTFLFSLQILSEKRFILRRIERDIKKTCIGLSLKYRLFSSDLNETWIFAK